MSRVSGAARGQRRVPWQPLTATAVVSAFVGAGVLTGASGQFQPAPGVGSGTHSNATPSPQEALTHQAAVEMFEQAQVLIEAGDLQQASALLQNVYDGARVYAGTAAAQALFSMSLQPNSSDKPNGPLVAHPQLAEIAIQWAEGSAAAGDLIGGLNFAAQAKQGLAVWAFDHSKPQMGKQLVSSAVADVDRLLSPATRYPRQSSRPTSESIRFLGEQKLQLLLTQLQFDPKTAGTAIAYATKLAKALGDGSKMLIDGSEMQRDLADLPKFVAAYASHLNWLALENPLGYSSVPFKLFMSNTFSTVAQPASSNNLASMVNNADFTCNVGRTLTDDQVTQLLDASTILGDLGDWPAGTDVDRLLALDDPALSVQYALDLFYQAVDFAPNTDFNQQPPDIVLNKPGQAVFAVAAARCAAQAGNPVYGYTTSSDMLIQLGTYAYVTGNSEQGRRLFDGATRDLERLLQPGPGNRAQDVGSWYYNITNDYLSQMRVDPSYEVTNKAKSAAAKYVEYLEGINAIQRGDLELPHMIDDYGKALRSGQLPKLTPFAEFIDPQAFPKLLEFTMPIGERSATVTTNLALY